MSKLVTTAAPFLQALKLAALITATRNTIPVLSCIKVDGGKIIATDLDIEIEVPFPAQETTEPFLLHLPHILSIMSGLPGDTEITLTFESEEVIDALPKGRSQKRYISRVILTFDGARYTLTSQPVSDWPELATPKKKPTVLRADNLGLDDAFKRTRHAISTEETRYYLNGACLTNWNDGTPCIVTTDGHRMSIVDVPGASHFDDQIVPRKIVDILLFIGSPHIVEFWKNETWIRLKFAGGISLTGRLIDGSFPDWQRVVPKMPNDAARVQFDMPSVSRALRRMTALSTDRSKSVSITLANGAAFMGLKNAETGSAVERVSANIIANNENAPDSIGLNARYIIEDQKTHGSNPSTFVFPAGNREPIKTESDGAVGVLMPLRIDDGPMIKSLVEAMVA